MIESDCSKRILSCADGAASFNFTATKMGLDVISCDPLYAKSIDEIKASIFRSSEIIFPKIVDSKNDFNWKYFDSPENLKAYRLSQAQLFLEDFTNDQQKQKYICGRLPNIPWNDHSFDLALCGNFLFLYSEILSTEFHIRSVLELCRVSKEVRIFPLIGNDRKLSRHLECVLVLLFENGLKFTIEVVDYHFTKGAYQMLRIYKNH